MDNFTVGDRCLVHLLESEAGQPLNGQHVTLAKAIIENGRFKCTFDDGTFKQIKPCNLQIIHGNRDNKKTNKKDPWSNLDNKEDRTEKEVTTDDNDNKEEVQEAEDKELLNINIEYYTLARCWCTILSWYYVSEWSRCRQR